VLKVFLWYDACGRRSGRVCGEQNLWRVPTSSLKVLQRRMPYLYPLPSSSVRRGPLLAHLLCCCTYTHVHSIYERHVSSRNLWHSRLPIGLLRMGFVAIRHRVPDREKYSAEWSRPQSPGRPQGYTYICRRPKSTMTATGPRAGSPTARVLYLMSLSIAYPVVYRSIKCELGKWEGWQESGWKADLGWRGGTQAVKWLASLIFHDRSCYTL